MYDFKKMLLKEMIQICWCVLDIKHNSYELTIKFFIEW